MRWPTGNTNGFVRLSVMNSGLGRDTNEFNAQMSAKRFSVCVWLVALECCDAISITKVAYAKMRKTRKRVVYSSECCLHSL